MNGGIGIAQNLKNDSVICIMLSNLLRSTVISRYYEKDNGRAGFIFSMHPPQWM